ERCIFLPRPTGASGRVTTAATVCLDAASARSVGSAAAGVPAKTSRTARSLGDPLGGVRRDLDLRGGHARPLGLADGLHRELALLLVEPVDEQDAVEVIRLVLDAAGEELGALERDRVAVHVEAGRDHPGRAGGGELQAGQRQAAFVVF